MCCISVCETLWEYDLLNESKIKAQNKSVVSTALVHNNEEEKNSGIEK